MTQPPSQADPDAAPAGPARREGRLADPSVELRTDPRLHPGLRAALAGFEMDGHAPPAPLDRAAGIHGFAQSR
jgi:acetyl esterase